MISKKLATHGANIINVINNTLKNSDNNIRNTILAIMTSIAYKLMTHSRV